VRLYTRTYVCMRVRGGRVAKYTEWLTEEGLIKIQGYARDGLVNSEIAKAMGISRTTLDKWKKMFPEIENAIKGQKEVVDRKVENSLFEKCQGKVVKLRKPMKVKKIKYDPKTGRKIEEKEVIEYTEQEEYIPADTNAIKFWLINRKPEEWKQRVEVAAQTDKDNTGIIQIERSGDEEVLDGEYKEIEIEESE